MNIHHNPERPSDLEAKHAATIDAFRVFMEQDTPAAVGGYPFSWVVKVGRLVARETELNGAYVMVGASAEPGAEIYSVLLHQPEGGRQGAHYFFADDPYISSPAHVAIQGVLANLEINEQDTRTQAEILDRIF